MATLIRFFKPFHVLSQFTDTAARETLARYIQKSGVYPAGRLDFDSEGLLLLTDDGALQARIAQPRYKLEKTYLVQVEGAPHAGTLADLQRGIALKDGISRAVSATLIDGAPALPVRDPPVPPRYAHRHAWLKVVMNTGRNRQVRRMLAATGYPVLRLIRTQIGPWRLDDLAPGQWYEQIIHLPR